MTTDKANLHLNPATMQPGDVAKLLTAASGQQVSESMIQAAIDAGAPVSPHGTINLIELIAWLEQQNQR